MTEFLEAVTRIAGALVAVAAAVGVLGHRRSPFRWVYRRIFGEPFAAWTRRQVTAAMRPEVDRLDGRIGGVETAMTKLTERNDEQHAHNAEQLEAIWTAISDRDPSARTRSTDDPNVER